MIASPFAPRTRRDDDPAAGVDGSRDVYIKNSRIVQPAPGEEKVRIGKLFSKEFNLEPLLAAKRLAKQIGTIICVHAVHPESPYERILEVLEKGDILCHCYQSKGDYTILDANGKVSAAAKHMRLEGQIGTLQPGSLADVAIVKLAERPISFPDQFGNVVEGDKLFVPMQTFKAGRNVFARIDFAL